MHNILVNKYLTSLLGTIVTPLVIVSDILLYNILVNKFLALLPETLVTPLVIVS